MCYHSSPHSFLLLICSNSDLYDNALRPYYQIQDVRFYLGSDTRSSLASHEMSKPPQKASQLMIF